MSANDEQPRSHVVVEIEDMAKMIRCVFATGFFSGLSAGAACVIVVYLYKLYGPFVF